MGAPFNFAGGEILSKIGAAWAVSYLYNQEVDNSHNNWSLVATASTRQRHLNNSTSFHQQWLVEVLSMNERRLNQNRIGLNASHIKQMAREILAQQ